MVAGVLANGPMIAEVLATAGVRSGRVLKEELGAVICDVAADGVLGEELGAVNCDVTVDGGDARLGTGVGNGIWRRDGRRQDARRRDGDVLRRVTFFRSHAV